MRQIASSHPGTGAGMLASAMQLWQWTLDYLQTATDPAGGKLYHGQRQGVTFAMADALSWLVASRAQIFDVLELEAKGGDDPVASEGLEGTVQFLCDLCHTQAAAAAGEVSRICAELVFGYKQQPDGFTPGDPEDSEEAIDFLRLQNKLTHGLSGSRLAKDRAAQTVAKVMIPEALDYPA
jgi:hypothetical protein